MTRVDLAEHRSGAECVPHVWASLPDDIMRQELDSALTEIDSLRERIERLEAITRGVTAPSSRAALKEFPFLSSLKALRSVVVARGAGRVLRQAAAVLVSEGPAAVAHRVRALSANRQAATMFLDEDFEPSGFVNEVVPRRRRALGSDWHVGLIRSRTAEANQDTLPEITISAVTYNSERWLPGFFGSLLDQSYPLKLIDLILVDNTSTDGTMMELRAFRDAHAASFRSLRIIERPNAGFGAGHNAALEEARTDLVLVTNVDLNFAQDSLLRGVLAAQADDLQVACWELAQAPYEHPKYYDPVTLETPWSSHACVLLRRDAVLAVGGYDERIFMYGEDVELSYRLRGAGYLLRYLPWVSVTHFVELNDPSSRPRQLGGSLAASVLLRYRYASLPSAQAAERALGTLLAKETDPMRRQGIAEAIRLVKEQKSHFLRNYRPERSLAFSFSGFDYALRRDGHDIPVPRFREADQLPLVSIVTRTHGPDLGFLREAIASVLNQTYPSVEHVVVEDRGEYARALISETATLYGVQLRHVPSDGAGRSRAGNVGMAAARGELLILLDNDDLLFADHVATLATALADDSKLAAAYSLAWEVRLAECDSNGYREDLHTLHPQFRLAYSRPRLRRYNFIPIQSIAFRRQLFEIAGGFEEDLEALEDWVLWNKYAQLGPFVRIPRLTSLYHTPADAEVRARRQRILDEALEPVRARLKASYR